MSDATLPLLPPSESPHSQRRGARLSVHGKPLGRPPKSPNRRQGDLAKYIEAQYGSTPGQQIAQLAMVTPAQVGRARREALELGIDPTGLDPIDLAHLVKAKRLAQAMGVTTAEAYAAGHKARVDLLPYVHQRQPQAAESKTKAPATVYLIPEGEAHQQLPDFSAGDDGDGLEILEEMPTGGHQVGSGQSDDDA